MALLFLLLLPACATQVYRRPLPQAIDEGVRYLVKSQQPDGSWGTGREVTGNEIYSMIPGSHDAYRVATTALCVMALREAGEQAAHARGVAYLVQHAEARRDSGDLMYNTWAHLYVVQALSVELRLRPDPRVEAVIRRHLDYLTRYETHLGGWNYYDFEVGASPPSSGPTSFQTAAGLVALWEAKQSGLALPPKLVERALYGLNKMRLPNGAYIYDWPRLQYAVRAPANLPRGSVGRTQPCNFALWLWGDKAVGPAQAQQGLDLLVSEHAWLDAGRKRLYPHEAFYQTSAYYYYFDHYYAALLLEKLGDPARQKYVPKLLDMILPYQEPDGSWWDYAMWDYHKPYGTAFAVMTLLRCK